MMNAWLIIPQLSFNPLTEIRLNCPDVLIHLQDKAVTCDPSPWFIYINRKGEVDQAGGDTERCRSVEGARQPGGRKERVRHTDGAGRRMQEGEGETLGV